MTKRSLSPVHHLPPAKRTHLSPFPTPTSIPLARSSGFESLYDELILHIFTCLSYTDLCTLQSTNRNWARLSLDNQLWKNLYLREFGRLRLRGFRGFAGRKDGRETKGLPGRVAAEGVQDWKRMFRISANWRNGRCQVSTLDEMATTSHTSTSQTSQQRVGTSTLEREANVPQIALAGKYIIMSTPGLSHSPLVLVLSPAVPKHVIHVTPIRAQQPVRVTTLAVDQSSRMSANLHIAVCLSNGDVYVHELYSPSRKHHYAPPFKTPRTAPIIQAGYSHPVLVTLSESFSLSVYDLTHEAMQVVHVLTSFTSFPPTSLVLTMPEPQIYKLLLTYASPVYPAHWSVGVTEVILASANTSFHGPPSPSTSPTRPPSLVCTRSTRAFDIPAGWVDEAKLRVVRKQWGRKVGGVAATQTDGRWVVLAPALAGEEARSPSGGFTPASLPLQLYRLSTPPVRASTGAVPKLTFVRNLLGPTSPVSALALADGRCVSLGVDGRVWVWDLENEWGKEVTSPEVGSCEWEDPVSGLEGTIAFDERRIITAGASGNVLVRDFDFDN
ncbi:hypothetical protein B0F90DRAFT_1947690 [Multifurca ochricompacta]|uniref:F-box domain-containing protein n=1 Tax=Multifurca ochricompacta TaxID=376703 RepID=A0AAD4QQP5_9AGAM|nr:hypothetical protein B0F90DRAFT_1947690 [Multifurca ochricompacta]